MSHKSGYDQPVVGLILDLGHSAGEEPQGNCNAGNCVTGCSCSDDAGSSVVGDVHLLLLDFGGGGNGGHVCYNSSSESEGS